MKYICENEFVVDLENDDGFTTDDFRVIEKNSIWVFNTSITNRDYVRLFEVREDGRLFWIEIPNHMLTENFKMV